MLTFIPNPWQHFVSSIAVVLVLPVLPILLELGFTGKIRPETLLLTGAIYPVSIIAASETLGLLGLAGVISVVQAAAYGRAVEGIGSPTPLWAIGLSIVSIVGVFLIHALERYTKHVVNGKPFPG